MIALFLLVSLCEPIQGPTPPPPDSPVVLVTPTRYELTVRIDYDQQRLDGTARITLRNFSDTPVSEVPLLLYRLMEIRAARCGVRAGPTLGR